MRVRQDQKEKPLKTTRNPLLVRLHHLFLWRPNISQLLEPCKAPSLSQTSANKKKRAAGAAGFIRLMAS